MMTILPLVIDRVVVVVNEDRTANLCQSLSLWIFIVLLSRIHCERSRRHLLLI